MYDNRLKCILISALVMGAGAVAIDFPGRSAHERIYPAIILSLLLYLLANVPIYFFVTADDVAGLLDADYDEDDERHLTYANPLMFR